MTRLACCLLLAVVLTGCGGKKHGAAPTTTAAPVDVASCNQLEGYIRLVSQVVSQSVEAMTQSTHPKVLAERAAATQRNLSTAADGLGRVGVPPSLDTARNQLIQGLRLFSADFGRAAASVRRDDLPTAARQLVDRRALTLVRGATARIDRACGVSAGG